MLVLSRKVGQEIVIGDSVRLIVGRVAGNRVTLSIQAPSDIQILRGELRDVDQEPPEVKPDASLLTAM